MMEEAERLWKGLVFDGRQSIKEGEWWMELPILPSLSVKPDDAAE
jgi:hypothetical protein